MVMMIVMFGRSRPLRFGQPGCLCHQIRNQIGSVIPSNPEGRHPHSGIFRGKRQRDGIVLRPQLRRVLDIGGQPGLFAPVRDATQVGADPIADTDRVARRAHFLE
jgi:hypothetical protein